MKIGDLVRCQPESRGGIIIDWHIIFDRFGDAVAKMAIVNWSTDSHSEYEYPDMLEVGK